MTKTLRRYTVRYTNYLGTANKICYVYAFSKDNAWWRASEAIREQEHGNYPREWRVEAVLQKNEKIRYFERKEAN